jgi:hypothetical protein
MPSGKDSPRDDALVDAEDRAADVQMTNSRIPLSPGDPHADASVTITHPTPLRDGLRDGLRDPLRDPSLAPVDLLLTGVGTLPNMTERDTRALSYLVLLRLLGFDQLRKLAFERGDGSILRHRVRMYEDTGWITRWTAMLPNGSRQRCAVPTRDAIRAVVDRLDGVLGEDVPFAPLLRLMLPRTERRPLKLTESTPDWFAHQREVNHLVASIIRSGRKILWASAWDCPFPEMAENYTLPQPDYVLVEEVDGKLRVVFGEHDRGTEDVERFVDRKLALYDELAEEAADVGELFGITDFVVHVSVLAARTGNPVRRLQALLRETSDTAKPNLFSFTLAGWLHAYPAERVWFAGEQEPSHFSRHWEDHDALIAA